MKILVSDKLAEEGIEILNAEDGFEVDVNPDISAEDLKASIGNYDGIVIRSGTKLTAEALAEPGNLKAIARAGVGVDNIDIPTATKHGIVVMNAPDGNTISTAELTVALMLAVSRNVAPAVQSLKEGRWDRKAYKGRLLTGKTVGIIGLGRIGRTVAERCRAFDMKVVGYDPFVAGDPELAKTITLVDELDDLLKQADYLTVHTPKTEETAGLVGKRELELLPEEAYVINAARGGIIDEDALLEVLESGHLAGAGLDVYSEEPPTKRELIEHELVTCLPHLGASSVEAQRNVAVDACRNLVDYLGGREMRNALNVPAMDFSAAGELEPYAELGHRLGAVAEGLLKGRLKKITVVYAGDIARESYKQVTISLVMGMLQNVVSQSLNMVNALLVAEENGVEVEERTSADARGYESSIRLMAESDKEKHSIYGTVFHQRYPRITAIDDFYMEVRPQDDMLILYNEDRPGVIGEIGTIFGQHEINIASMSFGRKIESKEACMALTLDAVPPQEIIADLRDKPFIKSVSHVSLPPLKSEVE